ncbi:MAG: (Na+)-NQR maturation NqrM [Marinobacter sp.]|nr:(Na+)-NQR maturation NqrM [Marinobacter sp.]
MGTFFLVFLIVGILLAGMSIGVIMGREPIKGTCGGIGAMGMDGSCDLCGGDTNKCKEENDKAASNVVEGLAYNAAEADKR